MPADRADARRSLRCRSAPLARSALVRRRADDAAAQADAPASDQSPAPPARAPTERARMAAAHARGGQPAQLPGTFVVQRRRQRVERAHLRTICEGRHQYRAHRGARRPAAPGASATTTSCRRCWPATRVAMIEQRDRCSSCSRPAQAGRRPHRRVLRRARARHRARRRPRGRGAACSSRATRTRFGYRAGAERRAACCCAPTCSASAARCSSRPRFPTSSIGVKAQPEAVLQAMRKLDGYRVVRPTLDAHHSSTPRAGRCEAASPGFQPVSCISAPHRGAGEPRRAGSPQVMQAVFSDGLTYVSVFVEPYDPQRHRRRCRPRSAPPTR